MRIVALVLLAALVGTGCTFSLKDLASDQASLCASGEAAYVGQGKMRVCRANAPGTRVLMGPDGTMTLERAAEVQPVDAQGVTMQTIQAMTQLLQQLQAALKALAPPAQAAPVAEPAKGNR